MADVQPATQEIPVKPGGLVCLGGASATDELASDVRSLAAWPPRVIEHLWDLLEPNLAEPLPSDIEYRVRHFCRAHDVEPDQLGPGVRALRAFLRGAAYFDASPEQLMDDLVSLDPSATKLRDALAVGFDTAKQTVRSELQVRSLLDHGKVLEKLSWRVDRMAASQHGRDFDSAVVWMTLSYREGDERGRISLQAPPALLRELHAMCTTVLE